jgi:hypothetical protein
MAKKSTPEPSQGPKRLRVQGLIDAELRRRLGAYSGAHGVTESQVIEEALRDRLKGFYYGNREARASVTITPGEEGDERTVLAIRTG